jgi:hypothetical protein
LVVKFYVTIATYARTLRGGHASPYARTHTRESRFYEYVYRTITQPAEARVIQADAVQEGNKLEQNMQRLRSSQKWQKKSDLRGCNAGILGTYTVPEV